MSKLKRAGIGVGSVLIAVLSALAASAGPPAGSTASLKQPIAQPAGVSGKVAWRFEVLANYVSHRADVARDGTAYFNDSSGFLYALTPKGALKWMYNGHGSGSKAPVAEG